MSEKKTKPTQFGQTFSAEAGLGLPFSTIKAQKAGATYIPFSGDSQKYFTQNLYPQELAKLAFNAPTHNAAVKAKQMMILGEGFNLDLLSPKLRAKFEAMNDDGETANDILNFISWDYAIFGGFALKVEWNSKGEIYEIYHVPFTDVRVGVPNEKGIPEYYVVSNNWDRTQPNNCEISYVINKFNPNFFVDGVPVNTDGIPEPTVEQMNNAQQLIYIWDWKPAASNGMRLYPVPDYIGALDQIMTEYSIGIANKSKIDNGVAGKTLVMYPYLAQSEEEKREIDNYFRINFQGADKDGAVIHAFNESKDTLPVITNLPSLDADTYIELEKSTKQNIITAHRVPAILVEYNYGGGFNNRAEEMTTAYQQFQKTSIKSYQNQIVRTFNSLVYWMGFTNKENIEIMPFSIDYSTTQVQGGTSLTN